MCHPDVFVDKFATCFRACQTGIQDGTRRPRLSEYEEFMYRISTFVEGSRPGVRLGWCATRRLVEPDPMHFHVGWVP
jgi:hypothetical protein